MANDTLTTAILLTDIRARLEAQIAGCDVADRMGDPLVADRRHKGVQIVRVDEEPRETGTLEYTIGVRTVELEWWFNATEASAPNGDSDALAFAASIQQALVGDDVDTWALARKMRPLGRSPLIERRGGFYRGSIAVACHRAIPTA